MVSGHLSVIKMKKLLFLCLAALLPGGHGETIDLADRIFLEYDAETYWCNEVDKSSNELIFYLLPTDRDNDLEATVLFSLYSDPLDTSDDEAWERSLQDDLDNLMHMSTVLANDDTFVMDGTFSPWYRFDNGYGTYARYMGSRDSWESDVHGAFAAKGDGVARAMMHVEAPDEETLMAVLKIFDTVRFKNGRARSSRSGDRNR